MDDVSLTVYTAILVIPATLSLFFSPCSWFCQKIEWTQLDETDITYAKDYLGYTRNVSVSCVHV